MRTEPAIGPVNSNEIQYNWISSTFIYDFLTWGWYEPRFWNWIPAIIFIKVDYSPELFYDIKVIGSCFCCFFSFFFFFCRSAKRSFFVVVHWRKTMFYWLWKLIVKGKNDTYNFSKKFWDNNFYRNTEPFCLLCYGFLETQNLDI